MPHLFSLPAELTIYTIAGLHAQWLGHLMPSDDARANGSCEIDASAVAEVDAAGVQLLLSLSNTLARHQRGLRLADPAPALSRACTALGATTLLEPGELAEASL